MSFELRELITNIIKTYVKEYEKKPEITSKWGEPLVGFADAKSIEITKLREIASPEHLMPNEVLKNATVVVAYYVPFTKELAETNVGNGDIASVEWARTYEETNKMFGELNQHLIEEIKKMGYNAKYAKEANSFNAEKPMSRWSHRHLARLAGLGTFGINNMLITKKGCCGRYSTLVTTLTIETDKPIEEEYCLYKGKGICGVCVKRCPSGALTIEGYDRNICYGVCLKNAKIHTGLGTSYVDEDGKANSVGSDVCGKCVVKLPCSFMSR
jgi:epoxyqueuosine reductase QueG